MEEQIKLVTKRLKQMYLYFWLIPIVMIIAGEVELLPVGLWADDVRVTYIFETIGILVTAICIPLALKLFSLVLTKKIDLLTFPLALKRYASWSIFRLALLEVVIVLNLLCYYFTLSNTGNLCVLIALTTSLFCLPGEKKLRVELQIAKDE